MRDADNTEIQASYLSIIKSRKSVRRVSYVEIGVCARSKKRRKREMRDVANTENQASYLSIIKHRK